MRFVDPGTKKLLKSRLKCAGKVARCALFTPFQSTITAQRTKKKKGETHFASKRGHKMQYSNGGLDDTLYLHWQFKASK